MQGDALRTPIRRHILIVWSYSYAHDCGVARMSMKRSRLMSTIAKGKLSHLRTHHVPNFVAVQLQMNSLYVFLRNYVASLNNNFVFWRLTFTAWHCNDFCAVRYAYRNFSALRQLLAESVARWQHATLGTDSVKHLTCKAMWRRFNKTILV